MQGQPACGHSTTMLRSVASFLIMGTGRLAELGRRRFLIPVLEEGVGLFFERQAARDLLLGGECTLPRGVDIEQDRLGAIGGQRGNDRHPLGLTGLGFRLVPVGGAHHVGDGHAIALKGPAAQGIGFEPDQP